MSAVATTVRSTDLLNCNVNSSVNNDYTRLQRHFLFKAPLSVSDISAIFPFVLRQNSSRG